MLFKTLSKKRKEKKKKEKKEVLTSHDSAETGFKKRAWETSHKGKGTSSAESKFQWVVKPLAELSLYLLSLYILSLYLAPKNYASTP